jgi:hypothetical protein
LATRIEVGDHWGRFKTARRKTQDEDELGRAGHWLGSLKMNRLCSKVRSVIIEVKTDAQIAAMMLSAICG